MVPPTDLVKLPDSDKELLLSEIVDSAKTNYAISFQNKVKLEELQNWINQQIELYKSAK